MGDDVAGKPLSKAEMRVLICLTTWMTQNEIADRLFVSRHTISTQIKSIYRKLGVTNRGQAVAEAIRLNIIQVRVRQ